MQATATVFIVALLGDRTAHVHVYDSRERMEHEYSLARACGGNFRRLGMGEVAADMSILARLRAEWDCDSAEVVRHD